MGGSHVNPLTNGYICAKVRRLPEHVHGSYRVLYPRIREGAKGTGGFRRASWDEALERIAGEMKRLSDSGEGEAILPLSYGGSNGYLSQDTTDARLFSRLGASRLARTVCSAPSTSAAIGLYGKMAGVAISDYVHARLIVLWGVNPAASGIHLLPYVLEARKQGARLVVVDPRRTRLAEQADLHIASPPRHRPARGPLDHPVDLRDGKRGRGVPRGAHDGRRGARAAGGAMDFRARRAGGRRRSGIRWRIRPALRAGAPCRDPVRLGARAKPQRRVRDRRRPGAAGGRRQVRRARRRLYPEQFGCVGPFRWTAAAEEPPATRELNMNRLGRDLLQAERPVRLLFVYNANPIATLPNQEKVRAGLLREDLFTVVFDPVMTDTALYADVVLPATTFLERDELSRGYGAYVLQYGAAVIPPVGESRPNHEVFAELCRRTGVARAGDPETAGELTEAILKASARGPELRESLLSSGIAYAGGGHEPGAVRGRLSPHAGPQGAPRCGEAGPGGPGGALRIPRRPGDGAVSSRADLARDGSHHQLDARRARDGAHPGRDPPGGCGRSRHIQRRPRSHLQRVGRDPLSALSSIPLSVPGSPTSRKGSGATTPKMRATGNALVPDSLADLGGGACFNDTRVEVERLPA